MLEYLATTRNPKPTVAVAATDAFQHPDVAAVAACAAAAAAAAAGMRVSAACRAVVCCLPAAVAAAEIGLPTRELPEQPAEEGIIIVYSDGLLIAPLIHFLMQETQMHIDPF